MGIDPATIAQGEPELMLAVAVILQAVEDARRGDRGALAWLESEVCRLWVAGIMRNADGDEVDALWRAIVGRARQA